MEAHRLGALAVVEVEQGIVLVHPPGGPPDAPASLPSGFVDEGETPEAGAVRLVREQTGLEVELVSELTDFLQEGTPIGTVHMHGYLARVTGGVLLANGPEGPPRRQPAGPRRLSRYRMSSPPLRSNVAPVT
jgi:ADP-ribose pyrophosphatase YjhB (NUDIX family)